MSSAGWRAGVVLAAALPALGLPLLLARRGLLRDRTDGDLAAAERVEVPAG